MEKLAMRFYNIYMSHSESAISSKYEHSKKENIECKF